MGAMLGHALGNWDQSMRNPFPSTTTGSQTLYPPAHSPSPQWSTQVGPRLMGHITLGLNMPKTQGRGCEGQEENTYMVIRACLITKHQLL